MSIPTNDFARSRGSVFDDPDAAYEELRDRQDDDARSSSPVLTNEEQAAIDADELAIIEETNRLMDQRWGL